jgi:hypothetical protein
VRSNFLSSLVRILTRSLVRILTVKNFARIVIEVDYVKNFTLTVIEVDLVRLNSVALCVEFSF